MQLGGLCKKLEYSNVEGMAGGGGGRWPLTPLTIASMLDGLEAAMDIENQETYG
jgi:hypothetical protein